MVGPDGGVSELVWEYNSNANLPVLSSFTSASFSLSARQTHHLDLDLDIDLVNSPPTLYPFQIHKHRYIYIWPNRTAELVEHPSPVLGRLLDSNSQVQTLVSQVNDLINYTCRFLVRGLGITRIKARTGGLSNRISSHGAGGPVSQWGSTIKSPWVCTVIIGCPSLYYILHILYIYIWMIYKCYMYFIFSYTLYIT